MIAFYIAHLPSFVRPLGILIHFSLPFLGALFYPDCFRNPLQEKLDILKLIRRP